MIDTGDLGSAPAPLPAPSPAPVAPVAFRPPLWLSGITLAMMLAAIGLSGYTLWTRHRDVSPTPEPTPSVNAVELGKTFAPKLADSLAEGFETAATMIAAGTSVKEADEALKEKFQAARWAAFEQMVGPTFNSVVPVGAEPKDAATREAFARLHRDFARGLRGAP